MLKLLEFLQHPEKIINEIPLPTPLKVICSPTTLKVVPATSEIVVIIRNFIPGSITKFPAFSKPTGLRNPVNKQLKQFHILLFE